MTLLVYKSERNVAHVGPKFFCVRHNNLIWVESGHVFSNAQLFNFYPGKQQADEALFRGCSAATLRYKKPAE